MSDTSHFTHLHAHSHFSLLGGTASPEALAQQAAASGLKALALTDTFGLYGAVAFDKACRAAGIKPITGLVVPVAVPPTRRLSIPAIPGRSFCWRRAQRATARSTSSPRCCWAAPTRNGCTTASPGPTSNRTATVSSAWMGDGAAG